MTESDCAPAGFPEFFHLDPSGFFMAGNDHLSGSFTIFYNNYILGKVYHDQFYFGLQI
jgi:hypothetical protein